MVPNNQPLGRKQLFQLKNKKEMDDFNGEDLLNVLKEINVNTHGLTNVIKGWFDTDDKDMKNLLKWMCTSLSKENYLSPLELEEFSKLKEPLIGPAYEKEVKNFEEKYPGIFDLEGNELEIELLQDELLFISEQDRQLDEQLKINEALQHNLSKDLDNVTLEQSKSALMLKSTEERCNFLGEKLDDINEKLHEQLVKYGTNLYDFEFGSVPKFLNNMDIKECQINVDNVASFLKPLLETEHSSDVSRSVTCMENTTSISFSVNSSDSITNTLNGMKNRIQHSHQNYVTTKIEVQKAKEVLDYLNRVDLDSIIRAVEHPYTQVNRDYKEETKQRMSAMLKDVSAKQAERHISDIRHKYAIQELQQQQAKLDRLKRIEDDIIKFISQYYLLTFMYVQEKEDIDKSDQFFRKIHQYIMEDLYNCEVRTEKMSKIITKYEDESKNMGEKFKMIKSIVRILTNEDDFDLYRSVEAIGEFRTELQRLEVNMFCSHFDEHKDKVKELRRNVDVLQSFLTSGPTRRIVLIPLHLQQVLSHVDEHLKKQVDSVKSAVSVSCSMKKIPNKWQNYRRQLWMYFYTDSKKLFHVLQEVEDEFKKSAFNGVQK